MENVTRTCRSIGSQIALIGGGESAVPYTTVMLRLPNAAFVPVVDPQPDGAQTAVTSLQPQMAPRLNGGEYGLA